MALPFRTTVAALGFALATTLPHLAAAAGAPTPEYRDYRISFVDAGVREGAGAFVARMDLHVSSRGLLRGYYRPNEGAHLVALIGSVDGDTYDIRSDDGAGSQFTLHGKLRQDRIVGGGFIGGHEYRFTAVPTVDGGTTVAPIGR